MIPYSADNIFAKILAGDIPAVSIFENEVCIAIMDAFPQSKGHCLIVPRAASRNLLDADPRQLAATIPHLQRLAKATKQAMRADGLRIAQFNEEPAGQSVFHLHWHIIPVYEGATLSRHAANMADMEALKVQAELIKATLG